MNGNRLAKEREEQLLVITTACVAVVEEEWTLRVPTEMAVRAAASDKEALNLLQSGFVISVDNVDLRDEQDRVVVSVECSDKSPAS